MHNNQPILLVEDDQIDAMTVKRALRELHVTNEIVLAENGEIAINYLQNVENRSPCIILLDLNMPRMNGLEFLTIVKNIPSLRNIPVIVLTTSKEETDCNKSYNLGVAGYMVKPIDYLQFVETMRAINMYWTICELPK